MIPYDLNRKRSSIFIIWRYYPSNPIMNHEYHHDIIMTWNNIIGRWYRTNNNGCYKSWAVAAPEDPLSAGHLQILKLYNKFITNQICPIGRRILRKITATCPKWSNVSRSKKYSGSCCGSGMPDAASSRNHSTNHLHGFLWSYLQKLFDNEVFLCAMTIHWRLERILHQI